MKIIIIIFLIIVLFVLLKFKIKIYSETFSNLKKKKYIISIFFTEGLNEEAHNLINSIKNVNMYDNLIVTCLDKKSYEYMKKIGVQPRLKKTNFNGDADHGTQKFFDITIQKIIIIKDLLMKYKKTLIYSDTDIVFLKNFEEDIEKFIQGEDNMWIQDDTQYLDSQKPSDNLCTGFMFFKYNSKTIKLLDETINIMMKYKNNIKKLAVGGGADQRALNLSIKKHKPKLKVLNLKEYPNGYRYFNNKDTIYKTYIPKIVHNNWIKGTQNKINRFKKNNLWFVNSKN